MISKGQAEEIYKMYQNGTRVIMPGNRYVDGFATLEKRGGIVYIRSEVWSEVELTSLRFVNLYKPLEMPLD